MVGEARLEETDSGVVPAGAGWFVLDVRDAQWTEKPGLGFSASLTGYDEHTPPRRSSRCSASRSA